MRSEHNAVRVGVIGGGIWGEHHLRAARELELDGQVELVAVAARSQATVDKQTAAFEVDGFTDYRQMIDDCRLDAVTVATPDHLHREMVLHALDRGLHVLVEKPMDTAVEGCQDMVSAARAADRMIFVDFHKRYDPFMRDIRAQVQAGRVGVPQYAYAYMEDQIVVPTEWLASWAAESSPFWFLGVHQYDLVRWITGQEAVAVLAHGARGVLEAQGIDTYDSVSAQLRLEGGASVTIHTSWILPRSLDAVVNQGLRIVGTSGVVEMDAKDRGLSYCFADDGVKTSNPTSLQDVSGPRGPSTVGYFIDPIKDFYRNVQFLREHPLEDLEGHYPSGDDGLRATQLAAAVDASLERGEVVDVAH